ncbi:glycosyltransferase family 2 protein [Azoarcus sp. L1K30]|uniref:glycosyltransferase n=1 Tax=Azoarcus sp. L1K30 TaxID=2820277 RepID=UPI001B838B28|nr:glycosyltransferase family 2 protein [Azoarcus sp. L1K30]MBR0566030.1 glycosyltransferase family 2 protein [Azoarcus sp. L1K30]
MTDTKTTCCITAIVINFNTAALTVRCVNSLLESGVERVLVLDNGSESADYEFLQRAFRPESVCRLLRSESNLGFAAGSNFLIEEALCDAQCSHVLLLNSDAILARDGLRELTWKAMSSEADLTGGKVNRLLVADDGSVTLTGIVESHGIALYKTLLASNRKHDEEIFLGPTGGCALLSRRMLEAMRRVHGYVFDPDYFCYAEDTDLCIRARLMGYVAAYTDEIVAYHQGQASSGGGFSDFVYYHGIRNSIWTLIKSFPVALLVRNLHWVLLLHAGIVLRHVMRGKLGLTLRIYRDGFGNWSHLLRKRRKIFESVSAEPAHRLGYFVTPWFYEPGYLRSAIRQLFFFWKLKDRS